MPAGFVVPTWAYEEGLAGVDVAGAARHGADRARLLLEQAMPAPAVVVEITAALGRITAPLGRGYVAVRSSVSAGRMRWCRRYAGAGPRSGPTGPSPTGASGRAATATPLSRRPCWCSAWSTPDVAGVLFAGTTTRIEASWGLGESVVGGRVPPDTSLVTDAAVEHRALGVKPSRTDRVGDTTSSHRRRSHLDPPSPPDHRRPARHTAAGAVWSRLGRRRSHRHSREPGSSHETGAPHPPPG